jgi:hypothetical protein
VLKLTSLVVSDEYEVFVGAWPAVMGEALEVRWGRR